MQPSERFPQSAVQLSDRRPVVNERLVRSFAQRSPVLCGRCSGWSKMAMKTTHEEANAWLFKVVIIFIVAGFLLSLIPLAKAQEAEGGQQSCPRPFVVGAL
jgi:hypothetical protein